MESFRVSASLSTLPRSGERGRILPGGRPGKEIGDPLREEFRFVASHREGLKALRAVLAREPEVHLYFLSRIEREVSRGSPDGAVHLLLDRGGDLRGGLFLGKDRNLAVSRLPREALPLLVKTVLSKGRGIQVAVSPREEIDALASGLAPHVSPLLHRVQSLYSVDRDMEPGAPAEDLAPAVEEDLPWLAEAGFSLAREDLGLPAWTLNKARLRRLALRRIRKKKTFVIRRGGRPVFKINIAVRCPEGALIEGVFTDPGYRKKGLASGGVAALCRKLLEDVPLVALHVGKENLPARRAYERAGMREKGELGLLLYLPW